MLEWFGWVAGYLVWIVVIGFKDVSEVTSDITYTLDEEKIRRKRSKQGYQDLGDGCKIGCCRCKAPVSRRRSRQRGREQSAVDEAGQGREVASNRQWLKRT